MTQTPENENVPLEVPVTEETDFVLNLDLSDEADEEVHDFQINLDFGEDVEEGEETPLNIDLDAVEEPVVEASEDADEDSDPEVETALDNLREELRSKGGDWYVVHTYSGMENRVKQNIDSRVKTLNMEDYIYETLVPTEDAVEIRNGQKKNVTRTFLPGYVLVRMDMTDDSWGAIRHTPSVTGFVGHANDPVPLDLDEVERMLTPGVLAKVAADHVGAPSRSRKKVEVVDFRVGDSVMVVDGPFAGVHATITEINLHNQRLKANVEILGRETPVDLTFPQIQKVV